MKSHRFLIIIALILLASCNGGESNNLDDSMTLSWLETEVQSLQGNAQRARVEELFLKDDGRSFLNLVFADTFSQTVSPDTKLIILSFFREAKLSPMELLNMTSVAAGDGDLDVRSEALSILESKKHMIAEDNLRSKVRMILSNTLAQESDNLLQRRKENLIDEF